MHVTISRRYDFEASHFLPHVPDGHKCKTMHGHSYVVDIHVTGPVQESGPEAGMVVDFSVLDDIARRLFATFDHRPLNDLFANPTVEIVAPTAQRHISAALNADRAEPLHVRVHFNEGPRSGCIVPPYDTSEEGGPRRLSCDPLSDLRELGAEMDRVFNVLRETNVPAIVGGHFMRSATELGQAIEALEASNERTS